ncbi:MAG TPA: nitrilase-related carbon-nitrogen hydrolase [Candidatus Brocadiaceae bacterium]|nr:nitrilase-related carbon-nitrogen hydrolase [Candidatus Brocadiaceae bacterium]
MKQIEKKQILDLLDKPLEFLVRLYEMFDDVSVFNEASNKIFTSPSEKEAFRRLTDSLHGNIVKMFLPHSDMYQKTILHKIVDTHYDDNYHTLCLSLFKAIGEYLVGYRMGALKNLKELGKFGTITVTIKPPNPIYKSLDNPVKTSYGTGMHDITDICEKLSFIRETTGPKIRLQRNISIQKTNSRLQERIRYGFRIAVTPFTKQLDFEVKSLLDSSPPHGKTPFWFTGIKNTENSKMYLSKILETAIRENADVLVLPELTIDKALLEFLQNWLLEKNMGIINRGANGLLMVVAGSFHREESEGKIYNVSTVFNYKGDILSIQKKIQRYSFDSNDVKKNESLKTLLKTSDYGGYECIETFDAIHCIDTPIGRIAVCICMDYFHEKHTEALKQSGITVFLVPAMSHQNTRFVDIAKIFGGTNRASSFIANSSYLAKRDGDLVHKDGASFFISPIQKSHIRMQNKTTLNCFVMI